MNDAPDWSKTGTKAQVGVPLVYFAINAVQRAICRVGISKTSENKQQGYKFRGIDAVYGALSPLLAEHGLCVIPRMLHRTCEERQTKSGSTLFDVNVDAEFDFVAVADGSRHTVKTFGEAMDSGDKATNKAMSAAYKYAAFMTFAIPTEGDNDADTTTHDVAPKAAPSGSAKEIMQDAFNALSPAEQEKMRSRADSISDAYDQKGVETALDVYNGFKLDDEGKLALWFILDSALRSTLKKEQARLQKLTPDQKAFTAGMDKGGLENGF